MAKLPINRWQYDELENILQLTMGWEDAEEHMADTYTLIEPDRSYDEFPLKYLIFGYKQDATEWRLANDVPIGDTVLARDWPKLEGVAYRIKPIYANREWYRLNRTHQIVVRAQDMMYELERRYGHVL